MHWSLQTKCQNWKQGKLQLFDADPDVRNKFVRRLREKDVDVAAPATTDSSLSDDDDGATLRARYEEYVDSILAKNRATALATLQKDAAEKAKVSASVPRTRRALAHTTPSEQSRLLFERPHRS